MGGFARAFLRPAFVFVLVAAVVALLIVGIGHLLLRLHPEIDRERGSPRRPDFVRPAPRPSGSPVVLFGGAFLARPRGEPRRSMSRSPSGSTPFFAPVTPPPTDEEAARRGPLGTWADIQPGFTLYARNGALAKVDRSPPRRGRVRQVPARHSLRQRDVRRQRRDVDPARSGLRRLPGRPAPRSWRPRVTRSSTSAGTCRRRASAAVRPCTRRSRRSDEGDRVIGC